ncbi:MAG: sugar nucleotide-binding protein [Patescibacteria group bacterium]
MDVRKKIKFGVLGCSRVALKGMIPAINDSEFAELEMVGSRNPEKSKEVGTRFGAKSWGNYEDVLKNKNIQAIYVSLPNALHEEWTIRALEAGKHVICEKPTAISYGAAKRMVETAKKNNVRLLEGFMFRYHPQHAKVKELIANGVLGELVRFEGCFSYAMPDRKSNAMNKELAGGSFNDQAPYSIYASRMLFNEEPENVLCNMVYNPESGVTVKTDMVLCYPKDKYAFASSSFGSYFQSTYSILGTKAHIRMSRAYAVPREMETKIFLDSDDAIKEIKIEPADHFRLMVDDFCQEIVKEPLHAKDYENDLLAQAKVLEAARRSDAEKRIVSISEIDGDAEISVTSNAKHERILLTGASGNLGQAIVRSGKFSKLIMPTHEEMDLTNEKAVAEFFKKEKPDAVIHCAAMVKMVQHENEPEKAIDINIVGTCNIVKEVLRAERTGKNKIRFIYISTDGVYPGTRGNYSERDATFPYNKYGWEKLAGECIVNLLSDFCVIRTSFFDSNNIRYDSAATDKYSSRVPIDYLPKAIEFLLQHDFAGTVNIGGKRKSDYDSYKEYKPSIQACTYEDVVRGLPIKLARDASLDSSLWNKIKRDIKELQVDD